MVRHTLSGVRKTWHIARNDFADGYCFDFAVIGVHIMDSKAQVAKAVAFVGIMGTGI